MPVRLLNPLCLDLVTFAMVGPVEAASDASRTTSFTRPGTIAIPMTVALCAWRLRTALLFIDGLLPGNAYGSYWAVGTYPPLAHGEGSSIVYHSRAIAGRSTVNTPRLSHKCNVPTGTGLELQAISSMHGGGSKPARPDRIDVSQAPSKLYSGTATLRCYTRSPLSLGCCVPGASADRLLRRLFRGSGLPGKELSVNRKRVICGGKASLSVISVIGVPGGD